MGISAAVPTCSDDWQCRNVCTADSWHNTCSGSITDNEAAEFNKIGARRDIFISSDVVDSNPATDENDIDQAKATPRKKIFKAYSVKSSASSFTKGGSTTITGIVTDRASSATRWSGWASSSAPLSCATPREEFPEPLRFCAAFAKEKGERSFGFVHVPMLDGTGTLAIVSISDNSPVAQYNARQSSAGHAERMLCVGDRITAVGSCSGDLEDMRLRLRRSNIRLTVERWPEIFSVSLAKKSPSDSFGMRTSSKASKDGRNILTIDKIAEGQMDNWNKMKIIERRHFEVVTPGSEIVRVNGVEGDDVEAMEVTLKDQPRVVVVFRRPGPEELLQTWHRMAGSGSGGLAPSPASCSKEEESRDMAASDKPARSRRQDAPPRLARLPEANLPDRPRTRAV